MTKQPEATPQNLYQITGNVADMNTVLIERAELRRLQAENDGVHALIAVHQRTLERCLELKAECAELEAMLDAVGAGGVGQSIQPPVQADTAAPAQPPAAHQEPVAWIEHEWSGTGLRHLHFEKREPMVRDEVVNPVWTPLCTALPQRQPLTDEQIWADDGIMRANAGLGLLMKDIALLVRAIEQAHGITGAQ